MAKTVTASWKPSLEERALILESIGKAIDGAESVEVIMERGVREKGDADGWMTYELDGSKTITIKINDGSTGG